MASTYTASDGFEKIGVGQQNNTWGSSLDNDFDLVDQACDGVASIAVSSGSVTLQITDGSLSNGRCKVLVFTGSPSGIVAASIIPINVQKYYWIVNDLSQSITFSNGTGSSVTILSGTSSAIFLDGVGNVTSLFQNASFAGITTGNISVSGNAALPVGTAVTINGVQLPTYIGSLIPALAVIPGTLIITNITGISVSGGFWWVWDFGGVSGSRIRYAFGQGTGANGYTIPLPSGSFAYSNANLSVSINSANATAGNLVAIGCAVNPANGVVSITGSQSGGGTPGGNISWTGTAFQTGF